MLLADDGARGMQPKAFGARVPIPNATESIDPPQKLRADHFSRTHRDGRFKAAFFG
jgi:hypothetical protein